MNRANFDRLIFNPIDISDEELIAQVGENERLYRALGGDEGFLGPDARHRDISYKAKQMRYVLVLYDKESPLWMTHPDIVSRKKQAALLAGYDIIKEENTLQQMYDLKDLFLAKSTSAFIRYQHSDKLSVLISNEQVLYEMQSRLMGSLTDFKDDKQMIDHYKTKAQLLEEQDKILNLIEKYKQEIWRGDDVGYDKTMNIEFDRRTTPEKISMVELKRPRIKGINK